MMPYTVSTHLDELEYWAAVLELREAHCVHRRAAALRRAARVEDLEAVVRPFVQRKVRVAEHDRVGAVAEAAPQPLEAAPPRTGVMDQGDAGATNVHDPLRGQEPPQLRAVHIPVHADDRRPDGLELPQDLDRDEVAGVKQEVGGGDALEASIGESACATGEVRVSNYGDEHLG
jgi:hypothetical protein